MKLFLLPLLFVTASAFAATEKREPEVVTIDAPASDPICQKIKEQSRRERAWENTPIDHRRIEAKQKIDQYAAGIAKQALEVLEARLMSDYKLEANDSVSKIDQVFTNNTFLRRGFGINKEIRAQDWITCKLQLRNYGWIGFNSVVYPDLRVQGVCEKAPLVMETKAYTFMCDLRALDQELWPEIAEEIRERNKKGN